MRILAPAKVNLFLRVLAREASGYHQLETVFAALEFGDSLTLERFGSGIFLDADGPHLGPSEQNLVYRAARGFFKLAGRDEGLKIRLVKRIPVQGGLGGGSSDAGATLKALSTLFPGWVTGTDLLGLAGDLGSDVPYFLASSPLALAWGRGDRLLALPALPRAPVVLSIPPMGVRTPDAYRLLARGREQRPSMAGSGFRTLKHLGSWDEIAAQAENDFEPAIFGAFPLLGRIREALEETSPRFSLLSGSGSSLFSVFHGDEAAEDGKAWLQDEFPDCRFVLTHTLTEFPDPIPASGVEG